MSLEFSNTTTKGGIIQRIERNCGFQDGDITGDTTLFAQVTSDVNSTHDRALAIIFECGGTWQFDDSNHTRHPIIRTNLVAGQRDYSFLVDQDGNLILDIYRVFVKDTNAGTYREITPVDVQSGTASTSFTDGQNIRGLPNAYDKTGQAIFLDAIPNANVTDGLMIYINREGSYFTTADTTKKPGISGLFHEYYVLRPTYLYGMINQIANFQVFKQETLEMEDAIRNSYKARERDVSKQIIPKYKNTK